MKPDIDTEKAVTNIRAKTVKSTENSGQWTAVCEVKGCETTAPSSQLHGWSTKGWLLCPKHSTETKQ